MARPPTIGRTLAIYTERCNLSHGANLGSSPLAPWVVPGLPIGTREKGYHCLYERWGELVPWLIRGARRPASLQLQRHGGGILRRWSNLSPPSCRTPSKPWCSTQQILVRTSWWYQEHSPVCADGIQGISEHEEPSALAQLLTGPHGERLFSHYTSLGQLQCSINARGHESSKKQGGTWNLKS